MKKKLIAIIMIMVMCSALLLTGCGANGTGGSQAAGGKDPSKVLVMKVGEQEIYLNAVNYYALSVVESMGITEGTDMSEEYNDTYPTLDDAVKAQLLLQIRQTAILYQKAQEKGITLDDSQKQEVADLVAQYKEKYDADTLEKYGIDDALLTEMYTQYKVIRAMEAQLASELTSETEEYGTIETLAFLTVMVDGSGNAVTDDDGNYQYLTDAEKSQKKIQAEEALEKAKNGESFEDLIEEYGLASTSGTTHATTASLQSTYQLQDGEVSEIMEEDFGYLIVHMVAQKDEDYTAIVKEYNSNQAVQSQENAWFDNFTISEDDMETDVWNVFTFQDFV